MSVGAFEQVGTAFEGCQNARERIKALEMNGPFSRIAEEGEQFLQPIRGCLGAKYDLPPLFESMGCGVTIGQPVVNVIERDAQEHCSSREVSSLDFVGDQIVEVFHRSQVSKGLREKRSRSRIPARLRACGFIESKFSRGHPSWEPRNGQAGDIRQAKGSA